MFYTFKLQQSEYFQDDLFPPTRVLWEPTMTAESWTNGSNVCAKRISLKPAYMRSCKLTALLVYNYKCSICVFFDDKVILCVNSVRNVGTSRKL